MLIIVQKVGLGIFGFGQYLELAYSFGILGVDVYYLPDEDARVLDKVCQELLEYQFYASFSPNNFLARNIDRTLNYKLNLKLKRALKQLKDELPNPNQEEKTFQEWWESNRQKWCDKLRASMIKYRNIGHNWQFSVEQREALIQYYDANKLLVDCLNSDCYVSREVRQEIEDTLLLPIAEIE